jgi:acetyl-CoA synthetase
VKGQGIGAFCVLRSDVAPNADVNNIVSATVREVISPIATPDEIWIVPGLPKTRSGKIMRRILRKIGEGEYGAVGDTTTLAEPIVVEQIISRVKASRSQG